MTLLASLIAQAAAVPPHAINLAGPYVLSGVSLLAAITAAFRVGLYAGAFKEFKDTYDKKEAREADMRSEFVARTEMDVIVKHMDQRFDEVGRQLAEIRKIKLENQNR